MSERNICIMHSGLYGDLPSAKHEKDGSASGSVVPGWQKLITPAALAARRSALLNARGRGRGRGPGAVGQRSGAAGSEPAHASGQGAPSTTASLLERAASVSTDPLVVRDGRTLNAEADAKGHVQTTVVQSATGHSSLGVDDEYDPMHPNDFIAAKERLENARRVAEAEAEKQEALREVRLKEAARLSEAKRHRADGDVAELSSGGLVGNVGSGGLGSSGSVDTSASPAVRTDDYEAHRTAMLSLSGEEAFTRRAAAGVRAGSFPPSASPEVLPGTLMAGGNAVPRKGMSLAQRMLEKMGWKEGEGLGRNRQGIATPLVTKRTAATTGIIVPGRESSVVGDPYKGPGPRSRVIMLRNMVPPGGVDDGLDEEVGQECSRYGLITSVLIFEVTEPEYPADRAVRIFVQFESVESAVKAQEDLAGRYFAGRTVDARFFDEARFLQSDLAPDMAE